MARDYQRQLLSDDSQRIMIVKARQIGISQALAFIAAHEAIHGGTVVVVSRSGEQAKLFLDYVYLALRDAPHAPFISENQQSLELASGGKVITQGATRSAGRGIPASLVILDEFAWMPYDTDIYTSIMPTLSNGGRAIVCSTPNGRANKFAQMWMGADASWSRHAFRWDLQPEWAADPTWEATKTDEIGREAFAQEYGIDFAVSGGAVFDAADLDGMFCLPMPPNGRADMLDEGPIGEHAYLSTWDLGYEADATVGGTIDISSRPYQLVAFERFVHASYPEQQGAIERRDQRYPGRTVVESNGIGNPVIQNLLVNVDPFVTTAKSKKHAIDALKLLLQRGDLQAPPIPQMKREMEMYQRIDHALVQDCVMMLAIAASQLVNHVAEMSPDAIVNFLTRDSWGTDTSDDDN